MWSRLTEYAAEIVAPPSEDGSHDGDARVGDELWSRFTNIVAPTGAGDAAETGRGEHEDDDDDDQERYISELERALLQKKKQNEVLEQRIRELEASDQSGGEDRGASQSAEKDAHIARLEKELDALKRAAKANDEKVTAEAAQDAARVQQVGALQKRVAELEVQCGVLDATLREERASRVATKAEDASEDASSTAPAPSVFPTLVQAALTLSKSGQDEGGFEVGTTDAAVAVQLLRLAESTRQRMENSEANAARLHAALVSFFKMHNITISGENNEFNDNVQRQLGLISHRLSKGENDAREIEKLQQQLNNLTERDEKYQKTISALQTQLSGVQASKRKNDASLATRENEILAEVEKRERVITNLQASEEQLKHTLEQLGKELEDAHAEADELDKVCREQQQELKKLQRRSEQASELEATKEELLERVRELEKSAQEYEQGYLELLEEAETLKKQTEEEKAQLVATTEAQVLSTEQQMLYELQARLSACEADKLVAVQDADRLQSELDAMDNVLLQFRADHKQQRERLLQLELELEDARKSSHAKPGTSSGSSVISEEDFRRVMEVLSKRTQECDQLREALENAAKRFSETEMLDRQLAAQLVVSYLESDKKHEVLQLMSRMMGFTEEQKLRAGIHSDGQVVIPGNGGGGLFSSIFGIQGANAQSHEAPGASEASQAMANPEGKNINELWANFLIDEAKR